MNEFWITIAAIIVGPIAAVLISNCQEWKRRKYDRKLNVFSTLMKTRRRWVSPEHVEALNLVEVEFYKCESVLAAYKKLFDFFESDISRRDDESEEAYYLRKNEHHSNLLSSLLLEMSKELGYRHNQFEILRGGYHPQIHGQIESDNDKIRRLMAEISDGNAALPIVVHDVRHPQQMLEQARESQLLIETALQGHQKNEN